MTSQAALFPGQGSQEPGMGTTLETGSEEAAAFLSVADDVSDLPLSQLIRKGSAEDLQRTQITQPVVLTVSWMAYRALIDLHGVSFEAFAGLSLGEYVALMAADAIDPADAVRLVEARGRAMQEAADAREGGMVALFRADEETAEAICEEAAEGGVLEIASYLGPQIVVAGEKPACNRVLSIASDHGVPRADPLEVSGAFHTPLMEPAREGLKEALAEVSFRPPARPVYANVSGEPVETEEDIQEALVRQLTEPIRWRISVEAMIGAGVEGFVEVGPGTTLRSLVQRIDPDVDVESVGTLPEVESCEPP